MDRVWDSTMLVSVLMVRSSLPMRLLVAAVGMVARRGLVASAYDFVWVGCRVGVVEGVWCGFGGEGRGC